MVSTFLGSPVVARWDLKSGLGCSCWRALWAQVGLPYPHSNAARHRSNTPLAKNTFGIHSCALSCVQAQDVFSIVSLLLGVASQAETWRRHSCSA